MQLMLLIGHSGVDRVSAFFSSIMVESRLDLIVAWAFYAFFFQFVDKYQEIYSLPNPNILRNNVQLFT